VARLSSPSVRRGRVRSTVARARETEAARAGRAVAAQSRATISVGSEPASRVDIAGSPGDPLPTWLRARIEQSFGADLTRVRVHNDAAAVRALRDARTRGFAAGRDVFVDLPTHDFASERGLGLLGHEIAHVLQQTGRRGPRGVAATTISGDPSREPQHDDEYITRLDSFLEEEVPTYAKLKELYKATDAASTFADTDARIGKDWNSKSDAGAKVASLVTNADYPKRSPQTRAFLADCAKALAQYSAIAKRAVSSDGLGERTMFRSPAMYRAIRKAGVKWLPEAIAKLPNLGKLHPEVQLSAVRGWLFSIEIRDRPQLQDPWEADLAWAKDRRGEVFIAAAEAVTGLYAAILSMLSKAAGAHGNLPKSGMIEIRRGEAKYIANLAKPKPDVVVDVPELEVLLEGVWPKIQKAASDAVTYWSKVISLRDAIETGTKAYLKGLELTEEQKEAAALAAALPADPMFPMFGKTLFATVKTLLDPKLSSAEFTMAVAERREKHANLHKSFDQIRRARADKHVELGEDGLKLGAAAALLARVETALNRYDATATGGEQILATRIRLAELARELSSSLAMPSLGKVASDFLGDRPLLAITGEWKEWFPDTGVNKVETFKVDMLRGITFMGVKMSADEVVEWVEAGRNLMLLDELVKGMAGTPAQDQNTKTVLENVLASWTKGAGLHKYEIAANDYEAWFDEKWIDPSTNEVKTDDQAFSKAIFGHPETDRIRKIYEDTHESVSIRMLPKLHSKLWLWLIPRFDVWVTKVISDPALKKEVDAIRNKSIKPEWRSWMYGIADYIKGITGSDPTKAKQVGDRIKQIAADERLSSQNELAHQARLSAAKQIRSWLVGYDAAKRQPWWIPNRVWQEIYNFSRFIVGRPEEQLNHVAALIIDLAPELTERFSPPTNEADNAIGVGAMLVSGVISQWEAKGAATVIQKLLPEYKATDVVNRVATLRGLGKLLRDAASAFQRRGGIFADSTDTTLKTQTYRAKIYATTEEHPENGGFAWQGTLWRLREVKKSFWYHPPYPYLENDFGFKWPNGAPWVRQGIVEDEHHVPFNNDEELMKVTKTDLRSMEGEDLIIKPSSSIPLGHLYDDLSHHALFAYLDATGELIEKGFWVVYEIAEFIPGVGQGLMAARFAATVIDFLVSPEFQELISAIGNDGLGALVDKLTKFPIKIEDLVTYMLFAGATWAPKGSVDETKSARFTKPSGPWGSLGKAIKNLVHLVKRLVIAIQKVRSVVQVPFRATQVYVLEHPFVDMLLGLAIDYFDDLQSLSIERIMDVFSFDEKELKDEVSRGANAIVDGAALAFTNLRFLQVPSEIIPLGLIAETIFNVLIGRMGPKFKIIGGTVREVLQATNLWSKVTNAVGKQLGKFADPNDAWRTFVRDHLSKWVGEVRDGIAGEVKSGLAEIKWLSLGEVTKHDTTVTPSGDDAQNDFDIGEPSKAASVDSLPFLEDDPDALARWKTRPAIAIPTDGTPLDAVTRRRSERLLGQDLGHVRLHTGAAGARGTPPGARAVTAGSHVFLGPTVDRKSPSGESVLFHELAHVLQQSGPRPLGETQSTTPVMPRMTGMVWNEAAEAAAERAATAVDASTITRVTSTNIAGAQPLPTTTAKSILKKLRDADQIKKDAAHYADPSVQLRAKGAKDQGNITLFTTAIYNSVAARIDKIDKDEKPFAKPFHLVRPQIQAILVKRKPDIENAIRAIVFWKGALDKNNVFVVVPETFQREFERYVFGALGIAIQIVMVKNGPTIATKGDTVEKLDFGYVDLYELGTEGAPLIKLALDNSVGTKFGPKDKRAAFSYDKAAPEPWLLAIRLMLQRKRSPDLWQKKKFAFHEDALTTITTIHNEMAPIVKDDKWPDARVYANPDAPSGDFERIGLRVGTYGTQHDWIKGSGRDSHHVVQVVFIEYLQNKKKGLEPFPGLDTYPKAYENLGITGTGTETTKISAPDNPTEYLDVAYLGSGARADPMPTIFISNYTHRAKIHLHMEDDSRFARQILNDAFRHDRKEKLEVLKNKKVMETVAKTTGADRGRDIKVGSDTINVGQLHKMLYEATRDTYRAAWPPEHQERFRSLVTKLEPIYYNAVVEERRRKGKSVAAPSELTPSMTTAAVDRVIGNVDKIIGAHGFRPSK
jgi:hypothetical protein